MMIAPAFHQDVKHSGRADAGIGNQDLLDAMPFNQFGQFIERTEFSHSTLFDGVGILIMTCGDDADEPIAESRFFRHLRNADICHFTTTDNDGTNQVALPVTSHNLNQADNDSRHPEEEHRKEPIVNEDQAGIGEIVFNNFAITNRKALPKEKSNNDENRKREGRRFDNTKEVAGK